MVMPASMLDRKALRDLWALRGQVITIALLLAAGIAVFVMSVSNYATLLRAQRDHYASERFADAFVTLKRAPFAMAERIRLIDGVGVVETRIAATVRLDDPGSAVPVMGRLLSIPQHGQPMLNRLVLRAGSWLDPSRTDQILINEAFAASRGLRPGDSLQLILNGRLQRFLVSGTALSPEFVFATRPGDLLPDDHNFAVLWATERTVANAFDMFGAFNDVVLTLAPGASERHVLGALDEILAPFGSGGAITRRDHASHRFLADELTEQRTLAVLAPALFFGVAAFLLTIVVGRLVEAQREQIASLKALGFPTGPILRHYFLFVGAIGLLGASIGVAAGHALALWVVESYRTFFRFPVLVHQLEPWVVIASVGGTLVIAGAAVIRSVVRIVMLPAAEAMRAPLPQFRALALPVWLGMAFSARALVTLRGIIGRPLRALLAAVGIGFSMPLVVLGLFWFDAMAYMVDMTFERIQRGDVYINLNERAPASTLAWFRALDGVMLAEGYRAVPARLRSGHRVYRTAVSGLPPGADLTVPRRADGTRVVIPEEGLLLSRRLAERLMLRIGDPVTIEVLEGHRAVITVPLTAIADDVFGMSATMSLTALNTGLREGAGINAVALRVDPRQRDDVLQRLATAPSIATISSKQAWLALFQERIAGLIAISAIILTLFGVLIVVGVVYNTARVSFHERATELASLRVLGFTKAEVSQVLLGELAVVVVTGIVIGAALAKAVVMLLLSARSTESFEIPAVIAPATYVMAALTVLLTAAISAGVIRARIHRLDLVRVLKSRE